MNTIRFLGTGSSQGVPMIGCDCEVCRSDDQRDKRLRSSAFITIEDRLDLVIDAGMDFRYQMLREGIRKIDAILCTHGHKDHLGGLDDVRAFNYFQKKGVDIYAEESVSRIILKDYDYAFSNKHYPGIPEIEIHKITTEPFEINGVDIVPIRGLHYRLPVLGYKVENICYLTDFSSIDDKEIDKFKGVDVLVVNALRKSEHISHFSLDEALQLVKKAVPKRAFLTHSSHQLGKFADVEKELPEGVFLAYDGLRLDV